LNDYVDIIIEFINEKQKDYKESGLILWGHSNGGAIAIKIQDKRQKIKEI
jgi:alpha-beta hydrolase superfamily lysophospholipase